MGTRFSFIQLINEDEFGTATPSIDIIDISTWEWLLNTIYGTLHTKEDVLKYRFDINTTENRATFQRLRQLNVLFDSIGLSEGDRWTVGKLDEILYRLINDHDCDYYGDLTLDDNPVLFRSIMFEAVAKLTSKTADEIDSLVEKLISLGFNTVMWN